MSDVKAGLIRKMGLHCDLVIDPAIDSNGLHYATDLSSGIDLYANFNADAIELEPNQRVLIPTGVWLVELNPQLEIQIRSKSGLALKQGLVVLNSPGTIDADYTVSLITNKLNVINNKEVIEYSISEEDAKTKQICVILHNTSNILQKLDRFSKVAQMVLCPIVRDLIFITEKTKTRIGGFGSTGNN